MENNNKIDIEMADMVGKTYFKIATWYNKEFDSENERQEDLKHVSAEIIQDILEDTFSQLEGLGGTETKTVAKKDIIQDNPQTESAKNSGQMFNINEDAITKAMREKREGL